MFKKSHIRTVAGFTIIDLLVVIVVIAILAAVTVSAYNGIQARAANARIVASVNGSVKLLNMYHAETGSWPQESITPTTYVYHYCLGRDYPLFTIGGTSSSESPNIRVPRRGCTDRTSTVQFEADWMANIVAKYGALPQATALIDSWRFAPLYGVVYPGFVLQFRSISGLTYPVVNGTTQDGTAHFITYSLLGDVPDCGKVPHAQKVGTYDDMTASTTSCLIMLEFYGA